MVDLTDDFEDVVGEAVQEPDLKAKIDRLMNDAPLIYISVTVVMTNVNGVKRIDLVTAKGGLANPTGVKTFPPKDARDEAAKRFTKSLRKNLIKAQDMLAAGHGHRLPENDIAFKRPIKARG